MKWRLSLLLLIVVGGLVFTFWKAFGKDPHEVPFMLKGKPAPPFTLKRLDTGETVSLAQLRGRPLVLNFWATWCGPCREEQAVLDWGAQALKDKAQFYGVLFEDTMENTRGWFDAPSPYPQLIDPQSQIAVDYGVAGVPETYFIDADGVIRTKFVGPLDSRSLVAEVEAVSQPTPRAEAKP